MLILPIAVGTRVRSKNRSRQFGAVVSVSKKTAMVQWDGQIIVRPERCYLEKLTLETPADVGQRERDAAMRAWREAQPKTEIAHVEYESRWGCGSEAIGVTVIAGTPDVMRRAADELRVLADWFETKPKETT